MAKTWSRSFRQGNAIYKLNMLATESIRSVEDRFVNLVGLDIRTIRVLRLIGDDPGTTFAELTVMTAMERSLVSRMIQNLVRSGYVERRNDQSDARRFGLFITAAGQDARTRADLLSERGLEAVFEPLTRAEVRAFIATMDRLADWLDSEEFLRKSEHVFDRIEDGGEADRPMMLPER
ncbi:MarR family winged helix-turn-helix transcriptional regulator [Paracoccus sp. CPCC 101403]|uniref:MarR family winged helix-turn-helix transcriptional regulator n=1 Tax=Paracoccus broussonetiae TaxID=3075834 RepID=A0ABU3EJR3_9RHOB|nr:MarR family winged helix-turn-helix transcriptional regulator [Paracoccus sp. CPCC 101403]MDT1064311.1 MarR family winged helix-turn-helix transcriptional regulator [Paracoccus sp. CPCC 101403]